MAQTVQDQARIKLGSLEIGRFIAAALVMLAHVIPYVNDHVVPGTPLLFGGLAAPAPLGVQYFFVLSGFVMANAHQRDFGKPLAPFRFWWRRACRIYPVYWLALCVPGYYLSGGITQDNILHLITLDPWSNHDFVPVAWTLRYEMAFYIMFGLSLLPYIGKPLLVCWIGFTIWRWCAPLMRLFHPHFMMSLYWFSQSHNVKFSSFMSFYFFGGLAAGYAFARLRIGRRLSVVLLALSLIAFIAMLPVEQWGATYSTMPMFMLAMGGVIAAVILGLALLEHHGMMRLGSKAILAGAMSYPLYLLHGPVLMLIDNNLPWGRYHAQGLYTAFAIVIAAIMAVTAAVTLCYDQPVQRYARKLAKKMKGEKVQPLALLGTEAPE